MAMKGMLQGIDASGREIPGAAPSTAVTILAAMIRPLMPPELTCMFDAMLRFWPQYPCPWPVNSNLDMDVRASLQVVLILDFHGRDSQRLSEFPVFFQWLLEWFSMSVNPDPNNFRTAMAEALAGLRCELWPRAYHLCPSTLTETATSTAQAATTTAVAIPATTMTAATLPTTATTALTTVTPPDFASTIHPTDPEGAHDRVRRDRARPHGIGAPMSLTTTATDPATSRSSTTDVSSAATTTSATTARPAHAARPATAREHDPSNHARTCC